MVEISLNGEKRSFESEFRLSELIQILGLDPAKIVVQLNDEIVSHAGFVDYSIKEGDRVELLKFMAGG